MIFSEGDLIVLGIVALVLFLFRRLDKRRKDLEKVRRYSEKVQEKLDQIFQEKAQQMQDLSINFEVQEKTYREIFKRVQTAREELQGREDSLNELMSRLEGFDEKINGLYQLTSKVDENMIRLRDESEYVDSLGLRLKELQKISGGLEKKIKGITGDFSRENQEKLEQLKLSLIDDFEARLEIINEDLGRKGNALEEFQKDIVLYREASDKLKGETLDDLKEQLSGLEQEYAGHLNQAAQRGLDLEEQVFTQLEEKIQNKKSSLEENWFQGMAELREEVSHRVEEIKSFVNSGDQSLEQFRREQDQMLQEQEQRFTGLRQNMDELNETMERVQDSVEEARREALDSMRGSMDSFSQRIEQELSDKKRDLEEGFEEPLAFRDELIQLLEDMEQRYSRLQNDLEAQKMEGISRFEKDMAELSQGLEGLRVESLENFHDGVKDQRDQILQSMDSRFQEFSDGLTQLSGRMETIRDEVLDAKDESISKVRGEIQHFQEEMAGAVTDRKEQILQEMDRWHQELSVKMDQLWSGLEGTNLQARTDLEERILTYEKELNGKYDRFRVLMSELDRYEDSLSDNLAKLEQNTTDKTDRRLQDFEEEIRSRFQERGTELEELLNSWQNKTDSRLQSIDDHIDQKMQEELNQIQGRMMQEYTQLRDRSQESGEQIQKEILLSRENMNLLQSEVKNQMDEYRQWSEENFTDLQGNLLGFKERSGSEMEEATRTLQDLEHRIDSLKEGVLESAEQRFGNLERSLEQDLQNREGLLKGRITEWEEAFQKELVEMGEQSRKDFSDLQGSLNQSMEEKINRYQQGLTENYRELVDQAARYTEQIDQALEQGDGRIESYRQHWGDQVETLKSQAGEFSFSMEKALGELESLREQYKGQTREMQQELTERIVEVEGELQQRLQKTAGDLQLMSSTLEQDAMKAIEIRQSEYESTINGRFDRLESLTDDLDQLESSLRLSLNDQEERIQGEIESFHQNLQEKQEKEQESSNQRLGDIRRIIGQVEGELNHLKTQAYENVSEKLQLFEDDFFSNLRNREEAMKEGFDQWQKTIDLQMEELSGQALRSREELERNYQSQFKRKFHEIQTRVLEQMDKFQEQVQGFQNNLVVQIEDNEKNFLTHRQTVKTDLQKIRDDSLSLFHQEFEQYQQNTKDILARHDKEISMKLDSLSGDIEDNRSELSSLVTSSRNDISQWQNRVLAQLKNQESEVQRELEDFQSGIGSTIEELREDFKTQKDQLILASSQERLELRKDLNELSQDAKALREDLAVKSEQSLALLQQEGERFILDFQSKAGSMQSESDDRIRSIRQSLQDTRDRMDSLQKQLQSQVEEDYGALAANLEEMGHQQQEFIAQTRIFDQAETMRKALETDLEDLRVRTAQLERSRQELAPMEEEYTRLLKAYQDVSSRMNQFFSEKQKIDLLDGKVARINNLSEAIDVKLEQIDGTNDMLQEYLVRIRQLEDLHGDIAKRYQGLEKKATIVDATTVGVEKNLQFLSHIEKGLKSIGSDLEPMKNDLASIKASNQKLIEEKESVDILVTSLDKLEDTMADLETRQQRMDKAREWLASTETRLEKIGREAQEKVRLLGSLVEKDSKQGVRKTGSPDMNTREMVIQLARQGWSSEEIARQVKLSRGEVELILELSPPEE